MTKRTTKPTCCVCSGEAYVGDRSDKPGPILVYCRGCNFLEHYCTCTVNK